MRDAESIISLLQTIYHSNEWEDIEEYFECANSILVYNEARFRNIVDIDNERYEELVDSLTGNGGMFEGFSRMNIRVRDAALTALEPARSLSVLYEDAQEAWRDEINMGRDFKQTCYKYINFKH